MAMFQPGFVKKVDRNLSLKPTFETLGERRRIMEAAENKRRAGIIGITLLLAVMLVVTSIVQAKPKAGKAKSDAKPQKVKNVQRQSKTSAQKMSTTVRNRATVKLRTQNISNVKSVKTKKLTPKIARNILNQNAGLSQSTRTSKPSAITKPAGNNSAANKKPSRQMGRPNQRNSIIMNKPVPSKPAMQVDSSRTSSIVKPIKPNKYVGKPAENPTAKPAKQETSRLTSFFGRKPLIKFDKSPSQNSTQENKPDKKPIRVIRKPEEIRNKPSNEQSQGNQERRENRQMNNQTERIRPRRSGDSTDNSIDNNRRNTLVLERTNHGTERMRPRRTDRIIYEDRTRPDRGIYTNRFEHVYRDRHNRLCNRIVWPRYRFPVRYRWGGHTTYRYVYPHYQRKYVFVSIGGWWPTDYSYVRYYWYPSHFYSWYGYYPVAREIGGETYNYYTYNYYGDDSVSSDTGQVTQGTGYVDHTTFADVREKLQNQQNEGPSAQTLADTLFDEGVKAFEQEDYANAAEKFAAAMALAPDDVILPFARSQALFADAQYAKAAEVLRIALEKVTPEQQGVFYPRGLYTDEDVLMTQIYSLEEEAQQFQFNADLQLLLGYQWLGVGEIEKSLPLLIEAGDDAQNSASASVLVELAEKIKAGDAEDANENIVEQ